MGIKRNGWFYCNRITFKTVWPQETQTVEQLKRRLLQVSHSQCVVRISQLAFQHLFLYQVLHPADLHLIHFVHEAGPDRALVRAFHGLRLAGGVHGGGIVVSGGHTVAAVTEAEAPESWRNAGTSEGSPAALACQWPEVSVNLSVGQTTGSWLFYRNGS